MNDAYSHGQEWCEIYDKKYGNIAPALEIFFKSLNNQSIPWAIWKSLENLEHQLSGAFGDIDILIDESKKREFLECAGRNAFILHRGSISGNDDDIFILRSYDYLSGNEFMLHVHSRIRVGSKDHKEFWIPIDDQALTNCISFGSVRVVRPEIFLLIRVFSVILKDRSRQDCYAVGMAHQAFLLTAPQKSLVLGCFQNFSSKWFVKELVNELREGSFPSTALREKCFEFVYLLPIERGSGLKKRLRQYLIRRNKLGPLFITIYGHDGSGKTTAQEGISIALKKFGQVNSVYLGRNRWSIVNAFFFKRFMGTRILGSVWQITSFLELLIRRFGASASFSLGHSIVMDRGLYDVVIKYSSSSSYTPRLLSLLATGVESTSDDFKVLLVCDPEVAFQREASISCDEIKKRKVVYENTLSKKMPVLDTTALSKDQVIKEILDMAFRHFGQRNVA